MLPSLQARRVPPHTPQRTHHHHRHQQSLGLRKLNSSDGLPCVVLLLFLKPLDDERLPFSLNNRGTPFHPPMRALGLFAVVSFTLLIKPLPGSEPSVAVAVCQVPTSVCLLAT